MDGGKQYLSCPCAHCGKPVHYPAYAAGGMSLCSHCGKTTRTVAPPPASHKPTPPPAVSRAFPAPVPAGRPVAAPAPTARQAPPPSPSPAHVPGGGGVHGKGLPLRSILVGGAIAGLAYGGVLGWQKLSSPAANTGVYPELASEAAVARPAPPPTPPAAPAETPPAQSALPTAPSVAPTKSILDFKVGEVVIQRPKGTKGSRLAYAVGTLGNHSSARRLGVRVELEMLDGAGQKLGVTGDYCAVLDPGENWTFRALLNDPKAVAAKLVEIKEDP